MAGRAAQPTAPGSTPESRQQPEPLIDTPSLLRMACLKLGARSPHRHAVTRIVELRGSDPLRGVLGKPLVDRLVLDVA